MILRDSKNTESADSKNSQVARICGDCESGNPSGRSILDEKSGFFRSASLHITASKNKARRGSLLDINDQSQTKAIHDLSLKDKPFTQKPTPMQRCDWIYQGYNTADKDTQKLYQDYHDFEWGVPQHDEKRLFEQLVLEGMQAGLSWITILKKREAFRAAFDDFDPIKVAGYDEAKIEELMANKAIIRNRAKIESAINNAKRFLEVQEEFGSFDRFIWSFTGGKPLINHFATLSEIPTRTELSDTVAKDLKKRGFSFVGSVGIYAFMQSVGLVCDHLISCAFHSENKE